MHILIVEDELVIANSIKRLTTDIIKDLPLTFEIVHSVESAEMHLLQNEIDILFLDLHLNGENGFSLLHTPSLQPFHTIIISAYKEKAIDAFEFGVVDFIRKPITKERLQKAIDRTLPLKKQLPAAEHLSIKKGNKLLRIKFSDIRYIKAAGHYSEIYLINGVKVFCGQSINRLTETLPVSFCRVHKSYIVRIEVVKQVCTYRGSKYELELDIGTKIPIGRTFYKKITTLLFNKP